MFDPAVCMVLWPIVQPQRIGCKWVSLQRDYDPLN